MSADNYLYVRKVEEGHYDVTHRFASCYYRDEHTDGNPREDCWYEGNSEGWKLRGGDGTIYAKLEELQASIPLVSDDEMIDVPQAEVWYTTLEAAVMAAHKELQETEYPIEYGVSIQRGLI